jgi:hypothetical protein
MKKKAMKKKAMKKKAVATISRFVAESFRRMGIDSIQVGRKVYSTRTGKLMKQPDPRKVAGMVNEKTAEYRARRRNVEPPVYYVTVCKNTILHNLKRGTQDPPVRVSKGKHGKPRRFHTYTHPKPVQVSFHYGPTSPLPWGARVWAELREVNDEKVSPYGDVFADLAVF